LIKIYFVVQNNTNNETQVNGYIKGKDAPKSNKKEIIVAATA
jgi:hypothetical protein